MSLLTIVPTRNRYTMCKEMLESFIATKSENTHIVFIIDEDEPDYNNYQNLSLVYGATMLECTPSTITEHINNAWASFPDYDFYHISNDDVVYRTPGWDKLLCVEGKISYGNDLLQGKELCTFPVIPAKIAKAVGWLQCPVLNRYYGDRVWKDIGEKLGILHYEDKVIIEHKHFINYHRKPDSYETKENFGIDSLKFANWVGSDSINDYRKVRQCLELA